MSYLYQKCKKVGVTDFVQEIKRMEIYSAERFIGFIVKNIEDK